MREHKAEYLSWACTPLQSTTERRAAARVPGSHQSPTDCSFHEVWTPTASPLAGQRFAIERVYLTRTRAPSGFLNLSTPATAPRLLALFHARSAHGFHPSERCSSRAAVRRSRRRYPHDVCNAKPSSANLQDSRATEVARLEPEDPSAKEGLTSAPPGSCSTRKSATRTDVLGRNEHVALLSFVPSRVLISPE